MVPNLSFNPIKNKRAAKRMPEGWDGFRQGEMMRKAIVLACAVIICALPGYGDSNYGSPANPQAWEWRPVAVFGGLPIWFSAAFTIGDKAFVGTGYGAENEFWQYDAGLDEWTQKANFPGKPRGAAVAFSIGGKGYVGLGFADEARFSDLWEFDPSANRWTQKASLPAAGRDHSAVFAIGSRAYIVGGMSSIDLKEVWEYDPGTDRWSRKADMPETMDWSAYFVLDGRGYIGAGGQRQQNIARKFWEYDPQTDLWARKAEFPGPIRFRAVGFSMEGKGYLGTGIDSIGAKTAGVLCDLWEYSPRADAWTQQPAFSGPARGAAVGFVLGSKVYIGTGTDAARGLLRDFWCAAPPEPVVK